MTGAPRRLQAPEPEAEAVSGRERIRTHGTEVRSVLTPFVSQGRKFTARAWARLSDPRQESGKRVGNRMCLVPKP